MNLLKRYNRLNGVWFSAIALLMVLGLLTTGGRPFFWLFALLLGMVGCTIIPKQCDRYLSCAELNAFLKDYPETRPLITQKLSMNNPISIIDLDNILVELYQQRALKQQDEKKDRCLGEQRSVLK